jgi:hypothetical protein
MVFMLMVLIIHAGHYHKTGIGNATDGSSRMDAIPNVVVRRFGAREIAPQGQEVERGTS